MYGVLSSYSGDGAKKLTVFLEERKVEIEAILRGVPGLMSWGLMRTPDGCTTFTLCKDKAPQVLDLGLSRRPHRSLGRVAGAD